MTRPDWLWEVNPFGKVPVLLYKVTVAMINKKMCHIEIVRSFAGESDLRVPGHLWVGWGGFARQASHHHCHHHHHHVHHHCHGHQDHVQADLCTHQTQWFEPETGCWSSSSTRWEHCDRFNRGSLVPTHMLSKIVGFYSRVATFWYFDLLCCVRWWSTHSQVIGPQMKIWFGWKIGQGPDHRAKVLLTIVVELVEWWYMRKGCFCNH